MVCESGPRLYRKVQGERFSFVRERLLQTRTLNHTADMMPAALRVSFATGTMIEAAHTLADGLISAGSFYFFPPLLSSSVLCNSFL